ncbi:acetyltransferase, ribosomal protein N-acetylase [Thiovulum sp. ES]|nr:acetyltransferase, ribosomal protein N-acetylase [Thiovulum sp. ES]
MFLENDLIYLRKLNKSDDFSNYLEMVNNVETLVLIDGVGRYPFNREDLEKYLLSQNQLFLSIFNKKTNEHIGNINMSNISEFNRSCQIGIILHKKFRRKGFAKSSLQLVIKHIFERLNFHRISLLVVSINDSAVNLYKNLGFKYEGTYRENYWYIDKYIDTYLYSILSTEYFINKKNTKENFIMIDNYNDNGLTILQNSIDKELIYNLQKEIVEVIEETLNKQIGFDGTKDSFVKTTTEAMWELVNSEPEKRNLVYQYIQRVPTLHQLANLSVLREFAEKIGMKKPSVRELKVQMYLPWEKLFFQCCHQDINSLDSENSTTFWFPLHFVPEEYAVGYRKGSHKEGAIKHEAVIDEENGVYHVCVPQDFQDKYPETEKAVVDVGDLIALNRMVFHVSPDFEKQKWARWTVLVRYDDLAENGMYSGGVGHGKYAELLPDYVHNYGETVKKIKEFLSKKPKINWREKFKV